MKWEWFCRNADRVLFRTFLLDRQANPADQSKQDNMMTIQVTGFDALKRNFEDSAPTPVDEACEGRPRGKPDDGAQAEEA